LNIESKNDMPKRIKKFFRIFSLMIWPLFIWLLSACSGGGLLSNVSVSPESISPNADGLTDVTRISYELSRSANLSIYLVDGEGNRHYFRDARRRSEGEYQVDFGGVIDGAMLPHGQTGAARL
jgi:hypothetical protein